MTSNAGVVSLTGLSDLIFTPPDEDELPPIEDIEDIDGEAAGACTPPNRGGPNPLLSGSNPLFTAVAALLVLTVLALIVTAIVLHAVDKKHRAKKRGREEDPEDEE